MLNNFLVVSKVKDPKDPASIFLKSKPADKKFRAPKYGYIRSATLAFFLEVESFVTYYSIN